MKKYCRRTKFYYCCQDKLIFKVLFNVSRIIAKLLISFPNEVLSFFPNVHAPKCQNHAESAFSKKACLTKKEKMGEGLQRGIYIFWYVFNKVPSKSTINVLYLILQIKVLLCEHILLDFNISKQIYLWIKFLKQILFVSRNRRKWKTKLKYLITKSVNSSF